MNTVHTLRELRAAVTEARAAGKRIAFVPTMGNLHDGHASLVRAASQQAEFVVASIFVNPLQFGAGEDLDKYPRTLAADQARLVDAGCNLLFAPTVSEMYPNGMGTQTIVSVPGVSEGLCGDSRPGHFDGVSTVVCKLFNMVQPDIALFGEKDYQQLAVIRSMVRDLNMPIEIIGQPTVRAADGLALSSRNGYLSEAERATAPVLYATLQNIANALQSGERDFAGLLEQATQRINQAGLRVDYLELREANSLQPAQAEDSQLIIIAAAYLGSTRLIDNLAVDLAKA